MLRRFPVPEPLADRARAWADGGYRGEVAATRPAATVLLLRDGDDGPEVFWMQRQPTMAFAAGMTVFPGGGVDPRDADADVPWAGPSREQWSQRLEQPLVAAQQLVCAAVRETFEECGVLLAGADPHEVVLDVSAGCWEADRQALLDRELPLSRLLRERSLVLRSDLLRPWAHWVTPELEPRRYDTWFFAATVPQGQRARHVEAGEAVESGWSSGRALLDDARAGRQLLMPPTLVAVEQLAAARSVAELLAADRATPRVLPQLVPDGDGLAMAAEL